MTITSELFSGLTTRQINRQTSSIGTDTITWGTGTSSQSGYGAISGGGTGYTYTTNTTSPWIATGTDINAAMVLNQSGTMEIKGKEADIKINGKSMKDWMEAVEERLNILTPSPELEKDWDDLRRLGKRYRALEQKCKQKAQMWAVLKKVQPKQP